MTKYRIQVRSADNKEILVGRDECLLEKAYHSVLLFEMDLAQKVNLEQKIDRPVELKDLFIQHRTKTDCMTRLR